MNRRQTKTALAFATLTSLAVGLAYPRLSAWAQTPAAQSGSVKSYEIDMPGTSVWLDTKVDVRGEAKLRFTATGQITYPADTSYAGKMHTSGTFGPVGLTRGFAD